MNLVSTFRGFPSLFAAAGISQELTMPWGTGLRRIRHRVNLHWVWNLKAFCSPRSSEQKSVMRTDPMHITAENKQFSGVLKIFWGDEKIPRGLGMSLQTLHSPRDKWQHLTPRSHMCQNSPFHYQPQLQLFWVTLLSILVIWMWNRLKEINSTNKKTGVTF